MNKKYKKKQKKLLKLGFYRKQSLKLWRKGQLIDLGGWTSMKLISNLLMELLVYMKEDNK